MIRRKLLLPLYQFSYANDNMKMCSSTNIQKETKKTFVDKYLSIYDETFYNFNSICPRFKIKKICDIQSYPAKLFVFSSYSILNLCLYGLYPRIITQFFY